MTNPYQHQPSSPYHLSVGGVVVDGAGRVAAQRFEELELHGARLRDLHLFMRETIEVGETIEEAFHRGLEEEMGIEAKVEGFLGSRVARVVGSYPWEKTTLYLLGTLKSQDESRRSDTSLPYVSEISWFEPERLRAILTEQHRRISEPSFDELEILERAMSRREGD